MDVCLKSLLAIQHKDHDIVIQFLSYYSIMFVKAVVL